MEFKVDDLVWAKMKGFPPWPARIIEPSPDVKAPKNVDGYVFLIFFGTSDVAWILKKDVEPHSDNILQDLKDKKKSQKFQQAIDELLLFLGEPRMDKQKNLPKVEGACGGEKKRVIVKYVKTAPNKRQILNNEKRKPAVKRDQSPDSNEFFRNEPSVSNEEDSDIFKKPEPLLNVTYGFMGLCPIGRAVLAKLVSPGMQVFLYDPDIDEAMKHIARIKEIKRANSASELIQISDIIFCCYEADSNQFADIVRGKDNIIEGFEEAQKLGRKPGYVQLTYIDKKNSEMINTAANGAYLVAPIYGSLNDVKTCKSVINVSGQRDLFAQCEKAFALLTSNYYFLGCDLDISSSTNVLLNTAAGTIDAALSETMVLADRLKLNLYLSDEALSDIMSKFLESYNIEEIVERMGNRTMEPLLPLKHLQKDMNAGLMEAEKIGQMMPMASAANELYKRGKQLNYSDADVSSIYKVVKY